VLSLNKGKLVDDTASRGASSARPRRDGEAGRLLAPQEIGYDLSGLGEEES
jgi:hypothetical protein